MDLGNRIFGVFAILLGVASLISYVLQARGIAPPRLLRFRKLEAMKSFWGERAGAVVHFIGYVLVPIAFGVYLLMH